MTFHIPMAPALSAEEDLRRTRLFLGTLGLTGSYLESYSRALDLKEAMSTAFEAANLKGADKKNFFTPYVKERLANDSHSKSSKIRAQLEANPYLLTENELQRLAKALAPEIQSRNQAFLVCDSAQLAERERHSGEYGGDPALIFLKAAGIRNPERMDHCGFIDAVYKLSMRNNVFASSAVTFLPLPLRERAVSKFLSHPTPEFAAQLGKSFRRSPKILEATATWSDSIDGRTNAFEHFEGQYSQEAKEQRFGRRWVVQYLMEHLTDVTTGRPVSPLDTYEYILSTGDRPDIIRFQSIALKPERTLGLVKFFQDKVENGTLRYDGDIPLLHLCHEDGMHRFGAQLLAQSRERSAQFQKQAAKG